MIKRKYCYRCVRMHVCRSRQRICPCWDVVRTLGNHPPTQNRIVATGKKAYADRRRAHNAETFCCIRQKKKKKINATRMVITLIKTNMKHHQDRVRASGGRNIA